MRGMTWTRPDNRDFGDRNRTRHDYVLAGIGLALALSVAIGLSTSVALRTAVAAASPVAAGLVVDALFLNPPRTRESSETAAGGRVGAD
ncbi:MAG: hypothetical protein ABEI11_01830 [Haloarculaceae archaeon]